MTRFERMDPGGPCVSPYGHTLVDVRAFGSDAPARVICRHCGKQGTVVVFDEDEP